MRLQPKKIMCAIDFSDFTNDILAYSVALCKAFHAKLFLVHIVVDVRNSFIHSEISIDMEKLQSDHISNAQELLGSLVKDLGIEYEILTCEGDPAGKISEFALDKKVDMVITATYGKSGFNRLLIGSVTEKLMKILHCPLLVLRNQEPDYIHLENGELQLKKILVGCDFSPDSKIAFEYGLSLAQEFQAEIYMTHVIKPTEHLELKPSDYITTIPEAYIHWRTADYFEMQKKVTEENRAKIDTLRSSLAKQLEFMLPEECKAWCTPHTILLDGEPYKELIRYAKEQGVDLIVLGIRGRTLWEKLMVGSTTDRVIRQAPCPVLAVRPTSAYNE